MPAGAEVPAGGRPLGPAAADEPWDHGNGIIGAVQMTANPPAGPIRWLLLGLTGALLVVGVVGAATVDNDSDSATPQAASVTASVHAPAATAPPTSAATATPTTPNAAP